MTLNCLADGYVAVTRCPLSRHPLLGVSLGKIVEDGNTMTTQSGKPIPFRKSKRKPGFPLVRPTARLIPGETVAVTGETVIRTMNTGQKRNLAA